MASAADRRWLIRFVYLFGGAMYVIAMQEVYYTGAGSMKTFLPPLPYFIGMMMVALIPPTKANQPSQAASPDKIRRFMLRISSLEIMGYISTYLGISYAGSTTFTIIYGSMSLVVAFVRWLVTGKTITKGQLAGILFAAVGVAVTTFDGHGGKSAVSMEWGIAFTLFGCFCYAGEYVYIEEALNVLPTTTVLFKLGKYCTVFFTTLFLTIGLPHHKEWIEDQVAAHHGRYEVVFMLYIMLIPCSFLKNYAWLGVIRGDGSVTTGLMQGIRSCMTFTMSHFFFCSADTPGQCFTPLKAVATCLVITGTMIYSYFVAQMDTAQAKMLPIDARDARDDDEDVLDAEDCGQHAHRV